LRHGIRRNSSEFNKRSRDTSFDYIIPRSSRYWEHDDRLEPHDRSDSRRVGRIDRYQIRTGYQKSKRDKEGKWKHDKFSATSPSPPRTTFDLVSFPLLPKTTTAASTRDQSATKIPDTITEANEIPDSIAEAKEIPDTTASTE